jgi:hypothetical protein
MKTPIGERSSTLALQSAGGVLTGKITAEGNSAEIFDGTAAGDSVSFKAAITSPMALTLEFTASVNGDNISGNVNARGVGSWPFSGTRT